jgi:hypothetical protein
MKLTPEQIQGVLELEPKAQIDRLQGERPYIRTGYWNRQRDLEGLNANLAKLGLKANEIDDYDEDTGWLYWYELEPISNELSPEDQSTVDKYEEEEANREVPRDYASMYENKTKNNIMKDINLNRWAKLAGINENDNNAPLKEGNEEWEGSINGLGKEDDPQGFTEMRDIILSKYPNEGGSTYRMEVYYNNDNVATGASGGFAIEKGNVYFDFKFKDGKVVDYSFNEQNY